MKLRLLPPTHPISGSITLPGSKSYTNRALVVAALCDGLTSLKAASPSDDSVALIAGLNKLGVRVESSGEELLVHGRGGRFTPFKGKIDVGPAGTTMRFLTSLCCLVEGGDIVLCGSERMHARPVQDLVEAWRSLGADITYLGTEGCPPLRIRGSREGLGSQVAMKGDISSQFFSSMLLVSPLLPHGLTLNVIGEQTSKSYIDMTLQTMKAFGVAISHEHYTCYRASTGRTYTPRHYTIEGDASGASYFWGLAAVSGGVVKVHNLSPNSIQGDVHFSGLLEEMGCTCRSSTKEGESWIEIAGPTTLQGLEADMESMPDTALTMAVIAACAEGQTHLTGLHTLRHKETDRLVALHQELQAVGIHTEITEDSITIWGGTPHGASIQTYDDHRMAMSFALLGSRIEGIVIEDPSVVTKSFPMFWDFLSSLQIGVSS